MLIPPSMVAKAIKGTVNNPHQFHLTTATNTTNKENADKGVPLKTTAPNLIANTSSTNPIAVRINKSKTI